MKTAPRVITLVKSLYLLAQVFTDANIILVNLISTLIMEDSFIPVVMDMSAGIVTASIFHMGSVTLFFKLKAVVSQGFSVFLICLFFLPSLVLSDDFEGLPILPEGH